MSALNWGQSGRKGAMPRARFGASSWLDRFVLPRMLRKPVRTLGRGLRETVRAFERLAK